MFPGMPEAQRKEVSQSCVMNSQLSRRHDLWKILTAFANGTGAKEGRLAVSPEPDAKGNGHTVSVRTIRDFNKTILTLPIIMLDAEGKEGIVKAFLPDTEVLSSSPRGTMPHITIHQCIGGLSKTGIRGSDKSNLIADFANLHARGKKDAHGRQ
jgi:hypothetical protein